MSPGSLALSWLWRTLLGALAAVAWGVEDASCSASGSCEAGTSGYPWPNVRGLVGQYGVSNLTAPKDLSKPSWRWHHPLGQYATVIVGGPVIDHEKSLYFTEMQSLIKMSPDGAVIWSAKVPFEGQFFPDGPSIHAGGVFQSTTAGSLCRFAMEDGTMQWCRKYYPTTGPDSKYVTSHDGVVVIGTDNAAGAAGASAIGGGSKHVLGIDAANGGLLWDFAPDTPTWNNMGMFTHDDTVVLQDWDARVYRLGLHNGTLLWKSGGSRSATWTDGGTIIGANGIVYAAHSKAGQSMATRKFQGGGVVAYRLSDGERLWGRDMRHGVFTWPVAGRLHGDERWTVVVAAGGIPPCIPFEHMLLFCSIAAFLVSLVAWLLLEACLAVCCGSCGHSSARPKWRALRRFFLAVLAACILDCVLTLLARLDVSTPFPFEITAFDAETGEVRWHYDLPDWEHTAARGDLEGALVRLKRTPWRPTCCPASFGSPSVDGDGVVYIGHVSGLLYAIKDRNSDGRIDDSEVQTFDAESAFLHSGPAFAPGLFAFSTCDSVWAWRT